MIKRDFCQLPGQKKPKTSYDIESKTPNPLTLFSTLWFIYKVLLSDPHPTNRLVEGAGDSANLLNGGVQRLSKRKRS